MFRTALFIMFTGCSLFVAACSSGNNNGSRNDTSTIASPQGMGADTTSAKTDSLRDSLNR
ncbi:MAG: hypothetical protein H7096_10700 [Flavobacterium sp.]|nr:hypothetical protein [Pedobacter sp.]